MGALPLARGFVLDHGNGRERNRTAGRRTGAYATGVARSPLAPGEDRGIVDTINGAERLAMLSCWRGEEWEVHGLSLAPLPALHIAGATVLTPILVAITRPVGRAGS